MIAGGEAPSSVLQVADYGGPYPGNFIAQLRALDGALSRVRMRQVLLFSHVAEGRRWLEDLRADGLDARVLPASPSQAVLRLVMIARHERASLVHTHHTSFDVAAWVVQQASRLWGPRAEVVWHVRAAPKWCRRPPMRTLKDLVKLRVLGATTYTAHVSDATHRANARRGMREDRAIVIPNGVELGRLKVPPRERDRVRHALGVADGEVLCLHYAWHPHVKGADIAVAAVRHLVEEEGVGAKLVLVGEDATREFVHESFPGGAPRWLHLAPPTDEVASYLSASDLFLATSRSEGFSFAVAEALGFGRPVALSDIPGTRWAWGAPGAVLFPSGSVDGLRRAIREILAWSSAERAARLAVSRDLVVDRCSVETWAQRVVALYQRILGARSLPLADGESAPAAARATPGPPAENDTAVPSRAGE